MSTYEPGPSRPRTKPLHMYITDNPEPSTATAYPIDTGPILYDQVGLMTRTVERPCRSWRTGPEHVTCVVTETDNAQGMSITDAAEQIRTILEIVYPTDAVRIIEHHPDRPDHHYDEVFVGRGGRTRWRCLNPDALAIELGPLFTMPWPPLEETP